MESVSPPRLSPPSPIRLAPDVVPPALPALLLALFLAAANPIGYLGGGADDWHYLQAARCAAEHGFCLPIDHWWRRITLVLPTGAVIALLGESRPALWLVPSLYSVAAIVLLADIADRAFGRRAAFIATLAFVLTPVVSERLIGFNIDMAEATFLLASVACAQRAMAGRAFWPLLSGVALALAILSRPTALAAVPLIAIPFMMHPLLRRQGIWFAGGLVAPLLVEAGSYLLAAGDPLLPWTLSLAHTRIPSSELMPHVDLEGSPLFNPDYIGGWKPASGISIHWTVNGLVNLLLHPAAGLTLVVALILLLPNRAWLRNAAQGRFVAQLVLAAMLYFGALVYAFAIDPKPRMFLPVVAVASLCIGVLGARLWDEGRRALVATCAALMTVTGLLAPYWAVSLRPAEARAGHWIAGRPEIAVDAGSARSLALVPGIADLPESDGRDSRRLLAIGLRDCTSVATDRKLEGRAVERQELFAASEPFPIALVRGMGWLGQRRPVALCLFGPRRT